MSIKDNRRIIFVDFARSLAIVLALFDHSMNDFGVWFEYRYEDYIFIRFFTSMATPTFLFLFGMMLELVHLKKIRRGDNERLIHGLLKRSFQCYSGYFLTVLAGIVGGILVFKSGLAAAIFFGKAHYGNILKLYTVLLLIAFPLLLIRLKIGILKFTLLAYSVWLLYPILSHVDVINPNIAMFTSTFFGFGGAEGPSVLFSISIIATGMLSASTISIQKKYRSIGFNFALFVLFSSILIIIIIFIGWSDYTKDFFSNVYRYNNHPIYYLTGISLALLISIICNSFFPIGSYAKPLIQQFMIFGRNSLSAFTIGNILLNVFSNTISIHSWNVLGPISFVFSVYMILKLVDMLEVKSNIYNVINTKVAKVFDKIFFKPITKEILSLKIKLTIRKSI